MTKIVIERRTPLVVSGHTLFAEGRVRSGYGLHSGGGSTTCSCGARSPELPSTAARQRWHRLHKEQVLAAKTSENE